MSFASDNSVLFSLSQLKALETERIRAEAEAEAARLAAIAKARRDAEERARLAAEAERRADEERRQRERDERERARRQAQLKLIEAEARMEEEAQRLIEAARLESEARVKIELDRARPVGTIVALSVAALLAVVGLGGWLMHSEDVAAQERRAVLAHELEARHAAMQAAADAERARFDAEMGKLRERLAAAETAAERDRLQEKMAEAARAHERRALAAKRDAVKKMAAAGQPKSTSILDGDTGLLGD